MKKSLSLLILLLLLASFGANAKWYTDQQYKFKINVPDTWKASSYIEGTNKVYDFTSPDENVALQLRAFKAEEGITADLIAKVFEEEFTSQGATKLSLTDDELNGTHGKLGIYKNSYDGKEVALITFSAVKNQIGYLFLIIVPVSMFDQKVQETDAILNTFTILEDHNQIAQEKEPKGLGGLSGDKNNTQQPTTDNNVRIGTTLPPGKIWQEGVWPEGKYDCGKDKFLGIIGLNDSHISWTGDNYIFTPSFYLPKGDATWDTRLDCPNYENYCRIIAEHRWNDSQGSYLIKATFPQREKNKVRMQVWTSSTGWIGVVCTKIE